MAAWLTWYVISSVKISVTVYEHYVLTSQTVASAFRPFSALCRIGCHVLYVSCRVPLVAVCPQANLNKEEESRQETFTHMHTMTHTNTHSGWQFSITSTGRTTKYNIKEKEKKHISFHLVLTSVYLCASGFTEHSVLSCP